MTGLPAGALRTTIAGATVLAVTAAVYWRALHAGFVGDDFMILYRLRPIGDIGDTVRFFRGEFFEYYRPLGFVSHAIDWLAAGANAREFHLTNLLLHLANTTLVLLIVRALMPGLFAATAAALLFALHASNHEAVVWMSARFDLLATFFSLAAVLWLVRGSGLPGGRGAGEPVAVRAAALSAVLFFAALLSKESAVALPIVVAAWAVFKLRATTLRTIELTLPWLISLGLYSALRSVAGGIPATGGRLPKLAMFAVALLALLMLADSRWIALRERLRERRGAAIAAFLAAIVVAGIAALMGVGAVGSLAREKLSVAGFAVFYLLSPIVDVNATPYFLDSQTKVYWLGGIAALALIASAIALLWRRILDDEYLWFAMAFMLATLLPVSALTEGKRYLYLPSAAFAVSCALLLSRYSVRTRTFAAVALAAYVGVSAVQIRGKTNDWVWAGRMTAEGAGAVDASLAPACGGNVVFLTSPVGVRGVYTHFYYETFELPRGCRPDVFHILIRVLRLDTKVDVRWNSASEIVITAPDYDGNFVLSRDLRHYDVPLRADRAATLHTPLGQVDTEALGRLQRVSLKLDAAVTAADTRFFYYSEGRLHALAVK